jgi:hypothetical protein
MVVSLWLAYSTGDYVLFFTNLLVEMIQGNPVINIGIDWKTLEKISKHLSLFNISRLNSRVCDFGHKGCRAPGRFALLARSAFVDHTKWF